MKVIHGIDEPLRRITVSLSRYFKGIDCIERMKNSVVCRLTKKENRVLVLATYMQLLLLIFCKATVALVYPHTGIIGEFFKISIHLSND